MRPSLVGCYCVIPVFHGAWDGGPCPDWLAVRSDARGRFEIKDLPVDASLQLMVIAPGRATVCTNRAGWGSGQFHADQTDLPVVLPPQGKIEGVVVRKDTGEAVPGIRVKASPADSGQLHRLSTAVSDQAGRFVLGQLDSAYYAVEVVPADDVKPADWLGYPVFAKVEAGQTTAGVRIKAVHGELVKVVAIDAATSQPVAGIGVNFWSDPEPGQPYLHVNGNSSTVGVGVTELRAPPGKYHLDMGSSAVYNKVDYAYLPVQVVAGQAQQVVGKFARRPRLRGVVVDETGQPVAGAEIDLTRSWPERIASDTHGRFEMPYPGLGNDKLENEIFLLTARHAQRQRAGAAWLKGNPATQPVEVVLRPEVVITGTLVDSTGRGRQMCFNAKMAGASVRWETNVQHTDSAGRFRLAGLPAGESYTLQAAAEHSGAGTIEVNTKIGQEVANVGRVVLPKPAAGIAGIVVDEKGQPVRGAWIIPAAGYDVPSMELWQAKLTGDDGRFAFDWLPQEEVNLDVQPPRGPDSQIYSYSFPGPSAKAGDKNIVVKLEKPPAPAEPTASAPECWAGPKPALC
jgi:hypothetical protein